MGRPRHQDRSCTSSTSRRHARGVHRPLVGAHLARHRRPRRTHPNSRSTSRCPGCSTDQRAARQASRQDHQWSRLLDPAAALSARSYECAGAVTFEVVDPAGWAAGTFRLEADGRGRRRLHRRRGRARADPARRACCPRSGWAAATCTPPRSPASSGSTGPAPSTGSRACSATIRAPVDPDLVLTPCTPRDPTSGQRGPPGSRSSGAETTGGICTLGPWRRPVATRAGRAAPPSPSSPFPACSSPSCWSPGAPPRRVRAGHGLVAPSSPSLACAVPTRTVAGTAGVAAVAQLAGHLVLALAAPQAAEQAGMPLRRRARRRTSASATPSCTATPARPAPCSAGPALTAVVAAVAAAALVLLGHAAARGAHRRPRRGARRGTGARPPARGLTSCRRAAVLLRRPGGRDRPAGTAAPRAARARTTVWQPGRLPRRGPPTAARRRLTPGSGRRWRPTPPPVRLRSAR